jgi:hypothetical protein
MPYWYRRVFLLAIPLILSNLTQPLLSTVDTILSGICRVRRRWAEWRWAASSSTPSTGPSASCAWRPPAWWRKSHGAEDEDQLMHHFGRAFLTALASARRFCFFRRRSYRLRSACSGQPGGARQRADLLRNSHLVGAGVAGQLHDSWLPAGPSARPFCAGAAGCDQHRQRGSWRWGWCSGLHWGIAGIATATLAAEWTGCLLGLAIMLLRTGVHPRHLRWSELLHGPSLRHLFALNRDILLRTLSLVAAYAWFTRCGSADGRRHPGGQCCAHQLPHDRGVRTGRLCQRGRSAGRRRPSALVAARISAQS